MSKWLGAPLLLHKRRRNKANASFIWEMIELEKTLALCLGCQSRMPSRKSLLRQGGGKWQQYESVRELHGEGPCDYCREDSTVDIFVWQGGKYWREYEFGRRMVAEVEARERKLTVNDRRRFVA